MSLWIDEPSDEQRIFFGSCYFFLSDMRTLPAEPGLYAPVRLADSAGQKWEVLDLRAAEDIRQEVKGIPPENVPLPVPWSCWFKGGNVRFLVHRSRRDLKLLAYLALQIRNQYPRMHPRCAARHQSNVPPEAAAAFVHTHLGTEEP